MFRSRNFTATPLLAMLLAACSQPAPSPGTAAAPTPGAPTAPATSQVQEQGTRLLTASELQVSRAASPNSCNIEAVGDGVFATATAPIEVAKKATAVGGWLLSSVSRKSGVPAHLQLLSEAGDVGVQTWIDTWYSRPDVTAGQAAVDSGNAGFRQPVDVSLLPAGKYKIVVVFEDGGQSYSCDRNWMVVLK